MCVCVFSMSLCMRCIRVEWMLVCVCVFYVFVYALHTWYCGCKREREGERMCACVQCICGYKMAEYSSVSLCMRCIRGIVDVIYIYIHIHVYLYTLKKKEVEAENVTYQFLTKK